MSKFFKIVREQIYLTANPAIMANSLHFISFHSFILMQTFTVINTGVSKCKHCKPLERREEIKLTEKICFFQTKACVEA